jgi:rare lipoprotein A
LKARNQDSGFGIRVTALAAALLLSGCGLLPKRTSNAQSAPAAAAPAAQSPANAPATTPSKKSGAYYQDDGPGDNPPANLDEIPDAVPKVEPLRVAANRPYTVLGKEYVPQTALRPFRQRGVASWYGRKFHGAKTSSGEIYDMYAMTAAHPTLPIPSYARVTNLANKRSVIVRINDRGPFLSERVMDLSFAAAYRLGYARAGSATVEVESIDPAHFHPAKASVKLVPEPVPATEIVVQPAPAVVAETRPVEPETASVPAATPASATEAPAVPITTDASGVYLQLGAFSQRDNAETFRARIYQQLGWLTDVIHVNAGDGLYRLHLGPYRDRAEAERVAARIRETLELKPTMVVK